MASLSLLVNSPQRGLFGQLMWLATQVIPQWQAPLSLLLGYVGVATVSTMLDANKLTRRALFWAQTPLVVLLDGLTQVGLVAVKGHRHSFLETNRM